MPQEHRGLVELLRRLLERIESLYHYVTPRLDDASWVGYRLSELLPIPLARKQHFIEIASPLLRLRQIDEIIAALSEDDRSAH